MKNIIENLIMVLEIIGKAFLFLIDMIWSIIGDWTMRHIPHIIMSLIAIIIPLIMLNCAIATFTNYINNLF